MKKNFVFIAAVVFALFGRVASAESMLEASGVKGGVVVCVGADALGQLSNDWKSDRYIFQCLETSDEQVSSLRDTILAAGCYGKVTVLKFDGKQLPYADNLVNLLVVGAKFEIQRPEVDRVLTPNGVAFLDGKKISKPWPKAMDEWTHFLYGPDNNAVSKDSLVQTPRGIQWVSGPRWGRSHEELASMSATVSAGGRVFFIADEAPPASIRFMSDWKLTARDAFNGTLLWKKDIPQWIDHLRQFRSGPAHLSRRLVAIGNTVFVTPGLAAPVTAFDGATGETLKVYPGTEHTEEIIYENGILYLAVGTSEAERMGGGLHRRGEPEPTGFRAISAVDAASGRTLWKNEFNDEDLLPLSLTVRNGSVICQSTKGVVRLDAKSGKPLWKMPRETMARRMGYSAPTLVAADGVLLCADRTPGKGTDTGVSGGKVSWGVNGWDEADYSRRGDSQLVAYSEANGKELWSVSCTEGYNAPVDIFVVGDSVWVGSDFKEYDLKTGKLKRELDWNSIPVSMGHHRCYRDKATGNYIFTGRSGVEVVNLETGLEGNNSWMRGTCQYGVMPANGLLYAPPDACACNSKTKVQGFFAANTAKGGITGGMPKPAPNALEKGPAYTQLSNLKVQITSTDWPMYRADNLRSGGIKTKLPKVVKKAWSVQLGGKLTQPVSAGGSVYVAASDAHAVYALNAADGSSRWRYTAGGRIDSAPTLYNDSVLFGSADGWVYCLRASDGVLAWRFRVAPRERQVEVFDQLESTWPVHGSVMVQNGVLYVTAGRTSYLDGGLVLCRLDPASGKLISRDVLCHIDPKTGKQTGEEHKGGGDMEGLRSDLLSGDGASVFMKHCQFDRDWKQEESKTPRLFCISGMLDLEWFVRSYWLIGTDVGTGYGGWANAAATVPFGRILSFDDRRAYGYGRVAIAGGPVGHTADAYHLYCADRNAKLIEEPVAKPAATGKKNKNKKSTAKSAPPLWSFENSLVVHAMALVGDQLAVAGTPDVGRKIPDVLAYENEPEALTAFNGGKGAFLRIVSTADGQPLSEVTLAALPVFDGMSAANGRLFVALQDGSLACFGD